MIPEAELTNDHKRQHEVAFSVRGLSPNDTSFFEVIFPLPKVAIGGAIIENDTDVSLAVFVGENTEGIPYAVVPPGVCATRPMRTNARYLRIVPTSASATGGVIRTWLLEFPQGWSNASIGQGGPAITQLSQLTDVDITGAVPGNVLVDNG